MKISIPNEAKEYILCHRSELKEPLCDNYALSVENDFFEMLPFLPKDITSILDIGAGLAGIDAILKTEYPEASITLLDSDGRPSNTFGYNETYAPYTSRKLAELIVGHPVTWLDVDTTTPLKADLVISLLSWGYHFPLSTYTPDYKYLIVDIRDGTCDIDTVFPNYKLIKKGENYARIYHQK